MPGAHSRLPHAEGTQDNRQGASSWSFGSFLLFRLITGLAIGGEYSAINSAIDELIPARIRGRVDLIINGTYWVGAAAGTLAAAVLLNPRYLPETWGWRLSFGLGALVGGGMILARRYVPESPRWLLSHGHGEEAEIVMKEIESHAAGYELPPVDRWLTIYPGTEIGFATIARTLLQRHRSRAVLGFVLIASQAFFYNGISFTYPLVLNRFFGVPSDDTWIYVLCMAVANFLGPLLLGSLFDSVGQRTMISITYAFSGVVIIISELFFLHGDLTATTQTLLWAVTCFSASAAASRRLPDRQRDISPGNACGWPIALFYSVGTAVGGLGAPALFGRLIDTGRPEALFWGYVAGAGLMIVAAGVEVVLGVDSERKSLEDIASPLSGERPTLPLKTPRRG